VYDRAVTCTGPGANYARSQTMANDSRQGISQPLLLWALTTMEAKKAGYKSLTAAGTRREDKR
jgi:hypothetical protein